MAFCPEKQIFATGELGPKPKIYLWSPQMETNLILKNGVIKGVCSLSFSPSGEKLAAVCIDDNHMVVVFNTEDGKMIACEKGDTAKIVDLDWVDENSFCTAGIKHFKTWTLRNGSLSSKRGSFGKNNNKLLFVKKCKNKMLCGSTTGEL